MADEAEEGSRVVVLRDRQQLAAQKMKRVSAYISVETRARLDEIADQLGTDRPGALRRVLELALAPPEEQPATPVKPKKERAPRPPRQQPVKLEKPEQLVQLAQLDDGLGLDDEAFEDALDDWIVVGTRRIAARLARADDSD